MNVYWRELKSYRKGLLFWCLGMIALVYSGMLKYAAYQSTGQSIIDLVGKFPHAMQVIFGMVGFDLTTASGFYGVLFLYIALMGSVHAVLLGADIISKEERDKTTEFLFTKPTSRANVITGKLLAGLSQLLVVNLTTGLTSIFVVRSVNKGSPADSYIIKLTVGLLCLQLIFFTIGTAIASASRKPKTSASIATSLLLALFIISYIVDFSSALGFLKFLTPFKYFDAATILIAGKVGVGYVILSLMLTAGLIKLTYQSFLNRDLKV